MKEIRAKQNWLVALVACLLVLAACASDSGGDSTTTSQASAEATTTQAPAETTTTEGEMAPPTGSLKFGHVSAGSIYDQIPVITNARLSEQGWDVEDVYFARTELTPQALAQNTIQMALTLYLEPLRTIQAGGDQSKINYVMENNGSEFVIVAKAAYPTCQDMDGIRFGIHGEVSTVSVAAVKWLTDVCGVNPEVLVIPGGDNRIIALENDELDATLVQLGDWIALQTIADPGKYVLVDSGDAMAISGAGYFINTDWLNADHDVAVAYIAELLRTFQMVHDDPSILADSVRANVEMPDEAVDQAVELYLDPGVVNLAPLDPLGGTPAFLEGTLQYFTPDELDEGMDINNFYDPGLVEEAIAYLEAHP